MAQKYVDIIFGDYAPDFGGMPRPEDPGYLVDAVNIRSTPNGWRGMPSFSDVTDASAATDATDYGHGVCFITPGSTLVVGGTGEVIHAPGDSWFFFINAEGDFVQSNNEGDSWTTTTPNTGDALDPFGDFILFGNRPIYVCESRIPITSNGALGNWPWIDLATYIVSNGAGTVPEFSRGARVGFHVVLGHQTTIQTSAIGTALDWPTPGTADARSKECIQEEMNSSFGGIRRILGGEKIGIVVQDTALTRMTYVGGSQVFTFDTYEQVAGNGFGKYSRFATDGKLWYWYNDLGFFATDGYSVRNLSAGKIDEAIFLNTLSHPNGSSFGSAQTIAYDPRRSLIILGSRQSDQYQLCYNTKDGRFSFLDDAGVMTLISGVSEASDVQTAFNVNASTRNLQRLGGSTGTIALQTGYIELVPDHRFQLVGAHLIGTGVPGSLTLSYKVESDYDNLNVSQSGFTALTAASRGNKATGRANGQFVSFRVTGTGAESQLIRGIRVFYEPGEPA